MTDPNPLDPRPPPGNSPPERLDYAPTRRRAVPSGFQALMGAIGTTIVLLAIATSIPFMLGVVTGLAAFVAVAILFVVSAVKSGRRTGSRGWLVGVLVGIGLSFLIYGACWMFVAKGMHH